MELIAKTKVLGNVSRIKIGRESGCFLSYIAAQGSKSFVRISHSFFRKLYECTQRETFSRRDYDTSINSRKRNSSALCRTRIGNFHLNQAIDIETLKDYIETQDIPTSDV